MKEHASGLRMYLPQNPRLKAIEFTCRLLKPQNQSQISQAAQPVDSRAFNHGSQKMYILNPLGMLFYPAMVLLKVFPILIKAFQAQCGTYIKGSCPLSSEIFKPFTRFELGRPVCLCSLGQVGQFKRRKIPLENMEFYIHLLCRI